MTLEQADQKLVNNISDIRAKSYTFCLSSSLTKREMCTICVFLFLVDAKNDPTVVCEILLGFDIQSCFSPYSHIRKAVLRVVNNQYGINTQKEFKSKLDLKPIFRIAQKLVGKYYYDLFSNESELNYDLIFKPQVKPFVMSTELLMMIKTEDSPTVKILDIYEELNKKHSAVTPPSEEDLELELKLINPYENVKLDININNIPIQLEKNIAQMESKLRVYSPPMLLLVRTKIETKEEFKNSVFFTELKEKPTFDIIKELVMVYCRKGNIPHEGNEVFQNLRSFYDCFHKKKQHGWGIKNQDLALKMKNYIKKCLLSEAFLVKQYKKYKIQLMIDKKEHFDLLAKDKEEFQMKMKSIEEVNIVISKSEFKKDPKNTEIVLGHMPSENLKSLSLIYNKKIFEVKMKVRNAFLDVLFNIRQQFKDYPVYWSNFHKKILRQHFKSCWEEIMMFKEKMSDVISSRLTYNKQIKLEKQMIKSYHDSAIIRSHQKHDVHSEEVCGVFNLEDSYTKKEKLKREIVLKLSDEINCYYKNKHNIGYFKSVKLPSNAYEIVSKYIPNVNWQHENISYGALIELLYIRYLSHGGQVMMVNKSLREHYHFPRKCKKSRDRVFNRIVHAQQKRRMRSKELEFDDVLKLDFRPQLDLGDHDRMSKLGSNHDKGQDKMLMLTSQDTESMIGN
jgi:hypothetical protein